MAKVSLENKAPQINRPVGSLDELRVLGVPSRNICTCSDRGDKNAGCPMDYACDRPWKGTRPRMQVLRLTTRDGRVRVSETPCFEAVRKELDADDKGNLVEIIGGEGDEYTYRGSERRNKNCPDCANGECKRTHVWDDKSDLKKVCGEFPPAATHPELVKFAHKVRAKTETGVQKRENLKAQLYGPGTGGADEVKKESGGGGKRT